MAETYSHSFTNCKLCDDMLSGIYNFECEECGIIVCPRCYDEYEDKCKRCKEKAI